MKLVTTCHNLSQLVTTGDETSAGNLFIKTASERYQARTGVPQLIEDIATHNANNFISRISIGQCTAAQWSHCTHVPRRPCYPHYHRPNQQHHHPKQHDHHHQEDKIVSHPASVTQQSTSGGEGHAMAIVITIIIIINRQN